MKGENYVYISYSNLVFNKAQDRWHFFKLPCYVFFSSPPPKRSQNKQKFIILFLKNYFKYLLYANLGCLVPTNLFFITIC